MPRYIRAVECAEKISERLNIPLAALVDIFADVPSADVVPRAEIETAIRNFADRLITYYNTIKGTTSTALTAYHIEQIANEMIGEKK